MSFSDGDFIDPKLGGLVGVNVMDRGSHSYDRSIVDGDGQVMAWIAKKFHGQFGIHSVIEHAGRDVGQKSFFARPENLDLGHLVHCFRAKGPTPAFS